MYKDRIQTQFSFCLNANQSRDLSVLIDEILHREHISFNALMMWLARSSNVDTHGGPEKFSVLKRALIARRFPLASRKGEITADRVFLSPLRPLCEGNCRPPVPFQPRAIFAEKRVAHSVLAHNWRTRFPHVPFTVGARCREASGGSRYSLARLKDPVVYLVEEHWDFIKPCPCTRRHISCGYWIFNMGFGCPYDCAYCFLQEYSNVSGIVLPANIDDFFEKFDVFYKKLSRPIRVGTGEFCDSLALDHITEYSRSLVPYFSKKPMVFFELKTKSAAIENFYSLRPASNIVISWSLNSLPVTQAYEFGAPGAQQRLDAAAAVQKQGWRIGFHFDPVVYYSGWERDYQEALRMLYSACKPPFAWISIGALRCHRKLKSQALQRFPGADIFYGELLLGEDKKLRYPETLRFEIFKNMIQWIRTFDSRTPVYLCMENAACWSALGPQAQTTANVESMIMGKK